MRMGNANELSLEKVEPVYSGAAWWKIVPDGLAAIADAIDS